MLYLCMNFTIFVPGFGEAWIAAAPKDFFLNVTVEGVGFPYKKRSFHQNLKTFHKPFLVEKAYFV